MAGLADLTDPPACVKMMPSILDSKSDLNLLSLFNKANCAADGGNILHRDLERWRGFVLIVEIPN